MADHTGALESPGWRPPPIREIRDLCEAEGIMRATHTVLERDNITVVPGGHFDTVATHENGLLFVGSHNKQYEYIALMDILVGLGRNSMKNIVKFYAEEQMKWAFGPAASDIVLPVYPRLLASDRKNIINIELLSRLLSRNSLKTLAESERLTEQSLLAASEELSNGGVVNIYPSGNISNNIRKPWRHGVGRIIRQVPEADREKVLYVPYHANNINRVRLLAAIAARGRGICGRDQDITIIFGEPRSIAEVVESLPARVRDDPKWITHALWRHYNESLAD